MTRQLIKIGRKLAWRRKDCIPLEAQFREALTKEPSQKALAAELGVSEAYLCDVKLGRRHVGDALIERIVGSARK